MTRGFKHCWSFSPIDFWENGIVCGVEEQERILASMPDEPRRPLELCKVYVPVPGHIELEPVYLCKGDNNGTTYMFADVNIVNAYRDIY